ncbi:MAG: COX15/CtaA family protein [Leucobacter sp.]
MASPTTIERPNTAVSGGRFLRIAAWISFVLNVVIIATGGTVRLTGSGLGCSDWPVCTPGSLVPTPELGIHGIIEFANRTITGPLLIAAILVLVLAWRSRRERKDLTALAGVVLALVITQALIGAFVVWLHLNANLVGVHYVVSLIIVCVSAAFLVRMYEAPGSRERAVPVPVTILTHVTTLAMAVTIFVGVLTTGAGPHSGDENVVRDGFDASLLAHVHAWPGYIALGLVVLLAGWSIVQRLRTTAWSVALLITLIVQIVVGVYQARNGLPPFAVGVHMVLAALTAAAMTVVVLRLKRPRGSAPVGEVAATPPTDPVERQKSTR